MIWHPGDLHGPTELTIKPADKNNRPAGGLSQTVLREVDFAKAVEKMRRIGEASEAGHEEFERQSREHGIAYLRELADEGSITDEYLVQLSHMYVSSVSSGQAKPLEHLADLAGKSAAAIKNHLWQATRKGLLERSPGRAGGRITEKAGEIALAAAKSRQG